jgi:hypothetical protein
MGELMCCENCPAVFHIKCVGLKRLPKGIWHCAKCTRAKRSGVKDTWDENCAVCNNGGNLLCW